MARKRMIDPGIWRNKGILRVSREARLLFLGMITNADDYGYGDADPVALKASIFPIDNDISVTDLERCRDELVTVRLIELKGNFYRLPGWLNYQKLRSDYVLDGIYKDKWNGAVTDPLQTRNGGGTQVNKVSKKVRKKVIKDSGAKKPRPDPPEGYKEVLDWWYQHHPGYLWDKAHGNQLKRLLKALGAKELIRRCQLVLDGAALKWAERPVSFMIIVKHINSIGTGEKGKTNGGKYADVYNE